MVLVLGSRFKYILSRVFDIGSTTEGLESWVYSVGSRI